MALKFFEWLFGKPKESGGDAREVTMTKVKAADFLDANVQTSVTGLETYLYRMAFWSVVRKIGAAVAAVEWETYRRGKKVKAKEYWSWNYSPNPNQSRQEFFQELVGRLFLRQEAIVVETRDGCRYVADGFSVTNSLSGDIYRDVTARGESIPGAFPIGDVLRFTISGERIGGILAAVTAAEGQLLKSSVANYLRSQGVRGTLKINDTAEADPDFEDTYSDLVNNKFKKYFSSENAVIPLFNGFDFSEKPTTGGSSKSELVGTRDIRNMMDDIIELTAQAMGVPVSIATGKNVTDADFRTFLTSSVIPVATMIASEANRKIYGRDLVFAGTYITANTAAVRYNDIFDVANPIDKLVGSGAFCINDVRRRLGETVIEEPWAWQHWMTKNYSSVEDLLTEADGGTPDRGGGEKGGTDGG